MHNSPWVLAYAGVLPELKGPVRRAEPGSAVLGRVSLGGQAVLERFAVLRADGHVIHVGAELHLGWHSTVHIAHEVYGATIGERVSVGANSVVHACTVGDDCVVQDSVSVLDGATVGHGSVIAAGSVVYPRHVLPQGQWCEGSPAVPVRPVQAPELRALHESTRAHSGAAASTATPPSHSSITTGGGESGYVAASVVGLGELRMGEGSSLWFGCIVEAAELGVSIGAGSNVQDNTVLRSS
ncbi:MAG: DapH/DapD/GlmU-related protein, partial [Burkholderiaceae bacterium]